MFHEKSIVTASRLIYTNAVHIATCRDRSNRFNRFARGIFHGKRKDRDFLLVSSKRGIAWLQPRGTSVDAESTFPPAGEIGEIGEMVGHRVARSRGTRIEERAEKLKRNRLIGDH